MLCHTGVRSFFSNLLRKKDFRQELSLRTELSRCLETWHLTLFCIAQVCGAGLYVMTGTLVRDEAGPAGSVSYLIGAVSAVFTAMCYAELCSLIPRAGSCYSYTYILLGEMPAFFVGWIMVSDYIVTMSSVAKAFSGTINSLTNGAIRNATRIGGPGLLIVDDSVDVVACGFILLLILITMTGAKSSMTFNGVVTAMQIALLSIIVGAFFVLGSSQNWHVNGGYFPYGAAGVFQGASITVFAFSGFDALANASEEAKNPKKSLPIAMFISLSFITFVYLIATISLTYAVPWNTVDYSSPFVSAFIYLHKPWLMWTGALATLLATGAAKVSTMYSIPRVFYALAQDGLLFQWMGFVWEKTRVPIGGLIFGGVIAAIMALFFSINLLAEFTSFGILISYIFIGVDLLLLRYNSHYLAEYNVQKKLDQPHNGGEEEVTALDYYCPKADNEEEEENDPRKSKDASVTGSESVGGESGTVELRDFVYVLSNKSFTKLKNINVFYVLIACFMISVLFFAIVFDFLLLHHRPNDGPAAYILTAITGASILIIGAILSCYKPIEFPDSFTAPWMPLTPFVTIIVNLVLLLKLPGDTWIRGGIWSFIGLVIYFCYSYFHSKQRQVKSDEMKLL